MLQRFVAVVAALAFVAPALAQEVDPALARQAEEHYQRATRAYEAKDWKAGAAGYTEAAKAADALGPQGRGFAMNAYYNLACCYALDGQAEPALEALDKAVERGWDDTDHTEQDPDLEGLREQARFKELVRKMKHLDWATLERVELPGDTILPSVRVYVTLPEGHDKTRSYPALFALPPGPGTRDMVRVGLTRYWEAEARRRGYVVLSVEIAVQNLQGRAARLVDAVLAMAASRHGVDRKRVAVGGLSNGGLGSFVALCESWSDRPFKALVGIPGAWHPNLFSPEELTGLEGLKGFPVLLRVGGNDTDWTGFVEKTRGLLDQAGAKVDLQVLEGQGHMVELDNKALWDWIDHALEAEPAPAGGE